MIVKVSKENANKYRTLFDKASLLLGADLMDSTKPYDPESNPFKPDNPETNYTNDNYINDIYEYFLALNDIIDKAPEEEWQYYTILPLPNDSETYGEPTFKVDANTRVITVPNKFKNIAVVGDNTAEIIYFEIDRFFDATDFGADEMIAAIEWQRTSNGNVATGISSAYTKELTIISDKVLIGWAIDEEIASEAGTIEFALRIFSRNESGEVDYSFSTLPAKATISKTLNLYPDQETDLDNSAVNMIKERIRRTRSPEIFGDETVKAPIWEINVGGLVDENGEPIVAIYPSVLGTAYYADLDTTLDPNSLTVTLEAKSENASGTLYYQWYEYNPDLKVWEKLSITGDKEDEEGLTAISGNAGGATMTFTTAGIYKCEAIDRVSNIRENSADSEILYILLPEKPVVKVSDETILDYDGQPLKYYRAILENIDTGVALTVQPGLNNNKFYDDTYDKNDQTSQSFSWKKSEGLQGEQEELKDESGLPEIEQEYYAKEEGYYFGYAVNTRNMKNSISDKATTYRVTRPVAIPTREDYTVEGLSNNEDLRGALGETIELDFANYKYDTIQYQWYTYDDLTGAYTSIEGATGYAENGKITYKPKTTMRCVVNVIATRNGTVTHGGDITDENNGTRLPYLPSGGQGHFIISSSII